VDENLKVLAHDKSVKQLVMDDIEFLHWIILPRIVHVELEVNLFARFRNSRRDGQVEMVFDRVGYSGDQLHATTRAIAGSIGADVPVHRTKVNGILRGIRRRLTLRGHEGHG